LLNKEKKYQEMPAEEKALLIAGWLYEKQAEDIVILDVATISSVTDMTIIVSARGVKHAQALADAMLDMAAEHKVEFLGMEGRKTGEWILLDFNDVLIHVFLNELREFYNVEGMWSEARRVDFEN